MNNNSAADAAALFKQRYGRAPETVSSAPGRVNLIGEHTDYNGGLVLPTVLSLETTVALGLGGDDGQASVCSAGFPDATTLALDGPPRGDWTDYVAGCLKYLRETTPGLPGLQQAITSDVPIGAGVSSSASLEVAVLRAVRSLCQIELDDKALALLGRRAENEFVGMPCGIMDQMVASVGVRHQALLIDSGSLETEALPLFDNCRFVTLHSGITHKLVTDGYETRVRECNEACAALEVDLLCTLDLSAIDRINALPEPIDRRARHVVTENVRVKMATEALRAGNADSFGTLMTESHASQRDDYAVSVPRIDEMVQEALRYGALGARLTGGGFGGAIVALVDAGFVDDWCAEMTNRFPDSRLIDVF